MNCKKIKLWLLLLVATLATQSAFADFAHDTVWYKQTDQTYGFWKLEFSDNASLIAASGYDDVIFYETATGKEIKRIPGESFCYFINNDTQFILRNKERTQLQIWDTKTFKLIDTLEYDDRLINSYVSLNKDKTLIGAGITNGFRIWDIESRKIFKTFTRPEEPKLIGWGISRILFPCNENEVIVAIGKKYETGNGKDPYYTTGSISVFDINTLDSINTLPSKGLFEISPNCKYIAYAKSNQYIEIYDFNTRELIHTFQLPVPFNLTGLKFSSDEKYLVTSSNDKGKGLWIWDLATGKIKYNDYTGGSISSIALSHNMKYIATSGNHLILFHGRYDYVDVADSPENTGTLYPNPTTGTYTLSYNQFANESTTIQITDLQGNIVKPIFSGFIEQGIKTYNISVNELPNGTYFVQVINEHQNLSLKLIIIK